jgi:hypothetical protein
LFILVSIFSLLYSDDAQFMDNYSWSLIKQVWRYAPCFLFLVGYSTDQVHNQAISLHHHSHQSPSIVAIQSSQGNSSHSSSSRNSLISPNVTQQHQPIASQKLLGNQHYEDFSVMNHSERFMKIELPSLSYNTVRDTVMRLFAEEGIMIKCINEVVAREQIGLIRKCLKLVMPCNPFLML